MQPRHKSRVKQQQQQQQQQQQHTKSHSTKRKHAPRATTTISTPKRLLVTVPKSSRHHRHSTQPTQQQYQPSPSQISDARNPTATTTATRRPVFHRNNCGLVPALHPITTTSTTTLPALTIPSLAFSTSAKRPEDKDTPGKGPDQKDGEDNSKKNGDDAPQKWYTQNKIYKMYKRYGKLAIVSVAGVYATGFVLCTTVPLLIPGYDPQAAISWLNDNGYIPQLAKDTFTQVLTQYPQLGEPIKEHPDLASKVLVGYLLNELAVIPRLAIALAITKSIGDKRIAKAQEADTAAAKTQQQNL